MLFPLKDENPTTRKPILTLLFLVTCVLIWFGWQTPAANDVVDSSAGQLSGDVAFNLERAAIPCEVVTGDPLSVEEIEATFNGGDGSACTRGDGDRSVFADKSVLFALVTSMFLHGGLMHLGGNMLFLWIFGNNIEDRLGHVPFAFFYLASGIAATAAHIAVQPSSTIPLVGASGAIAGVMGAYLVWFPQAPIRTIVFFFIRDITAKWFLGIWFVFQFFTGSDSGVAWMAHVGGFVFGALVALALRATGRVKSPRSPSSLPPPPPSIRDRSSRPTLTSEWDPTGGVGRGPKPHIFDEASFRRRLDG